MFKNYLKVALRNIIRQRAYALINVLGLATGIACTLIIVLFIVHEKSFDNFHASAGRIVRLYIDGKMAEQELSIAWTSVPTGPALLDEIPEVVNYTRIATSQNVLIRLGDRTFLENDFYWADSGFFEIFSFSLLQGNPGTVLTEPRSMVISEKMAAKYFGGRDPVGKVLQVFSDSVDYTITGVMKDFPENSHMFCDFVVDFRSHYNAGRTQWTNSNVYTYLLLEEGFLPAGLEEKIDPIFRKYVGPEIKQYLGISLDDWIAGGNYYRIRAQPLTDIHLNTDIEHDMKPSSDKKYIYIFSVIAGFIILIACINFMNLSTARSAGRAREVGLRKVAGSGRGQLILQFLGESFIMVLIALALALLIISLVLPGFRNLTHLNLGVDFSGNWYILPGLLVFALVVGLMAGAYPAFFLSSFRPVAVLSGRLEAGTGSSRLRSLLVVLQFGISIFIILGTLVISRQLSYLMNKDLGFYKDQLVVIQRFGQIGPEHVATFKQEIAGIPGVLSSTGSTMVPGWSTSTSAFMMEGRSHDQTFLIEVNWADFDFPETYGLEIAQGRALSPEYASDSNGILVNQACIRDFGIERPLETRFLEPADEQGGLDLLNVVGVMKDFHFASLHEEIRPYMLRVRPADWNWIPYLTARIEPQNMRSTLDQIVNVWAEFTNGQPFRYFFLDDDFARRYEQEGRTRIIFVIFSVLAIFVALIGLLGLTAFTTEQRTREIGIRKAMGASAWQIVRLISKEIVILIGISALLAWPAAYFFTRNWLNDFAYRIEPGAAPFILSFCIALVVSLIAVIFQAVKAALKNPAEALRYE